MTKSFDPYLQWLGIRDPERPPNHYRLLGVASYESDADVLINAADRQMSHVRTFQAGKHSAESQRLLNELAAAKVCLLNPGKKAAYDARLRAKQATELATCTPPALPKSAASAKSHSLITWFAATLLAVVTLVLAGAITAVVYFYNFRGESSGGIASARPRVAPSPHEPTRQTEAPPKPEVTQREPPPGPLQPKPGRPDRTKPEWPQPSRQQQPPPPKLESPRPESPQSESAKPKPPKPESQQPKLPKPQAAQPTEDKRMETPDAEAQAVAMKEIRELFKDRYLGAKDREQKREFAQLLLRQAAETRDNPAARFMLYSEARDMAAAAGDGKLLVAIITATGRDYRVDLKTMATETLLKAAKKPRDPAGNQSLARLALEMAKSDIQKEEYDRAKLLIEASREMARKARDVPTMKQTATVLKDLEELKQLQASFGEAEKVLAQKPDDLASNQVTARYYCLVKDDWSRGLPLLLNGADEVLHGAVEAETAHAPGSPAEMAALGDRWLEAARGAEEPNRYLARTRAIYWYQRALPKLAGLTRSKTEKRLSELSE